MVSLQRSVHVSIIAFIVMMAQPTQVQGQAFFKDDITSDTKFGQLEICSGVFDDDWWSRVGSPIPERASPIFKYRFCKHGGTEDVPDTSSKTCGSVLATQELVDGENFRAFVDEIVDRTTTGPTATHAAIGRSDRGTVCFYHYMWRGSGGGCNVACVGLSDLSERHIIPLEGSREFPQFQHAEVWFENNPNAEIDDGCSRRSRRHR